MLQSVFSHYVLLRRAKIRGPVFELSGLDDDLIGEFKSARKRP